MPNTVATMPSMSMIRPIGFLAASGPSTGLNAELNNIGIPWR